MQKLWDEWIGQKVQALTRNGVGVEGTLVGFDAVWLHLKQTNGVDSLVHVEDVVVLNRVPNIQPAIITPRVQ